MRSYEHGNTNNNPNTNKFSKEWDMVLIVIFSKMQLHSE